FVNRLIVLHDSHSRILGLFAAIIESRGAKRDVVSLPLLRRLTGVYVRRFLTVDGAAIAFVRLGDAERIEHLNLVSTLKINAAVPAALAFHSLRQIGQPELHVQLEVL